MRRRTVTSSPAGRREISGPRDPRCIGGHGEAEEQVRTLRSGQGGGGSGQRCGFGWHASTWTGSRWWRRARGGAGAHAGGQGGPSALLVCFSGPGKRVSGTGLFLAAVGTRLAAHSAPGGHPLRLGEQACDRGTSGTWPQPWRLSVSDARARCDDTGPKPSSRITATSTLDEVARDVVASCWCVHSYSLLPSKTNSMKMMRTVSCRSYALGWIYFVGQVDCNVDSSVVW